jgi:CDP-2,3-bis-(O-geranylgeranyl)-sn-glycerol synthase
LLHDIVFSLWFFLPAAEANVAPIFAAKLPGISTWDAPIDGGKKFRGKRILGDHKTWRGIVSGIILATLVLGLEQLCVIHFAWARRLTGQVDYRTLPTLLLGPLFAIGALGGDAIKSFFKRQRGTPAGQTWVPFDQLDYIIGGAVAALPFIRLTIGEYAWLFVIWFGIHLLSTYVGWRLGLKERPI